MRALLFLGLVLAALLIACCAAGFAALTQADEGLAPPPPPFGGHCSFTIPATYYGQVYTRGFEAQANSVLIARTDQFAWQGEPLTERGYVVDVYQRLGTSMPPCFTGGVIEFTLDGHRCWPWRLWTPGPHEVDLLCVRE